MSGVAASRVDTDLWFHLHLPGNISCGSKILVWPLPWLTVNDIHLEWIEESVGMSTMIFNVNITFYVFDTRQK